MVDRFEVSHYPKTIVQNRAIEKGWKEGESYWDYIRCEDVEVSRHFASFPSACRYAKACVRNDVFGMVHIYREQLIEFDVDLEDWEYQGLWWIEPDTKLKDLSVNKPDEVPFF